MEQINAQTLLTREAVAEYLAIPSSTVDFLRRTGQLPSVRVGRRFRYHPEDVSGFVDGRRSPAQVTSRPISPALRALRPTTAVI